MLDQDEDPELDDEWLTTNEKLTRFSKAREKIVGKVKNQNYHLFKEPNIMRKT